MLRVSDVPKIFERRTPIQPQPNVVRRKIYSRIKEKKDLQFELVPDFIVWFLESSHLWKTKKGRSARKTCLCFLANFLPKNLQRGHDTKITV